MAGNPVQLTLHDTGRRMDVHVAVLPATDSSANFIWRYSNDYTTCSRETSGYGAAVCGLQLYRAVTWEALAQGHRFQATNVCELTATELSKACGFEVQDSAKVAMANCLNLLDPQAAADCKLAVGVALTEGFFQRLERFLALMAGLAIPGAMPPVLLLLTVLGGVTLLQRSWSAVQDAR